jgi:endonuclease/exonuclease/phosphatase (EEP) superfamily protein YafD
LRPQYDVPAQQPEETVKFLFWNIRGKRLGHLVRALVDEHDADVVVLAELGEEPWDILTALNANDARHVFHMDELPTRAAGRRQPRIYWRLSRDAIRPLRKDDGAIFYDLETITGRSILLVAVHLPSRLHRSEHDLTALAGRLGGVIREEEGRLGHQRTVVVGDFNMNPFDLGMMTCDAFHAVTTQAIARRRSRTVDGQERGFFYNPMWGCLGDRTPGPPGTYYYDSPGQLAHFWNTFDQVLVRPDLLDVFDADSVRILARAGEVSLLKPKSDRPDQDVASDHLPLLFSLHLEGDNGP